MKNYILDENQIYIFIQFFTTSTHFRTVNACCRGYDNHLKVLRYHITCTATSIWQQVKQFLIIFYCLNMQKDYGTSYYNLIIHPSPYFKTSSCRTSLIVVEHENLQTCYVTECLVTIHSACIRYTQTC